MDANKLPVYVETPVTVIPSSNVACSSTSNLSCILTVPPLESKTRLPDLVLITFALLSAICTSLIYAFPIALSDAPSVVSLEASVLEEFLT